jgi:hypothetical protein
MGLFLIRPPNFFLQFKTKLKFFLIFFNRKKVLKFLRQSKVSIDQQTPSNWSQSNVFRADFFCFIGIFKKAKLNCRFWPYARGSIWSNCVLKTWQPWTRLVFVFVLNRWIVSFCRTGTSSSGETNP